MHLLEILWYSLEVGYELEEIILDGCGVGLESFCLFTLFLYIFDKVIYFLHDSSLRRVLIG